MSKNQINKIDQFLKDQKVRFLDLRLELIDHIATEIESNKFGNDYDTAISSLPKRYYPSQLEWIKEKKTTSLKQFWQYELMTFWKSYLTLPKILITISLIFLLAMLGMKDIRVFDLNPLELINALVSSIGSLICFSKFFKAFSFKTLLFENSLYTTALIWFISGPGIFNLSELIAPIIGNLISVLILASYTGFQIIILIGLLTEFPRFINSKMEATYEQDIPQFHA